MVEKINERMPGQLSRGALVGGLALLALGLIVVAGLAVVRRGEGPSLPAGYMPDTITVYGYGEASAQPDVAYVQLGLNMMGPDMTQVVAQNTERIAQIKEAVKAAGVTEGDIQTASYNVWPEDRYDPTNGMPTGERIFHADNMLTVKVRDLNRVSEVVQAALDAGATSLSGLTFGVADFQTLELQARERAAQNARERAEAMARGLGVTLGEPVLVTDSGSGGYGYYPPSGGYPYPTPVPPYGMGGMPPYTPGQTTITVALTVVFDIK